MELVISFILGVLSSIVAVIVINVTERTRVKGPKLALEGHWCEYVERSLGHQYSLGHIYYDRSRKMYAFDGTNYNNDGRQNCLWETTASFVEKLERKYYYIFMAHTAGQFDKRYYGFGVINLTLDSNGSLVPVDGHYISANVDEGAMSHSMIRTDLEYIRGKNGQEIIEFIDSAQNALMMASRKKSSKHTR